MNYIELFGVSSSGKSYVQDKIFKNLKKKNYNVQDSKIIIIKFFLKTFKVGFFKNIKLILLIIFYYRIFCIVLYYYSTVKIRTIATLKITEITEIVKHHKIAN